MYYHSGNYYGTWQHSSFNGIAPLFAVGASHDLNQNLYIGVQYMRFGSSWNTSKIHSQNQVFEHRGLGNSWTTPTTSAIDMLQVSLGYRFLKTLLGFVAKIIIGARCMELELKYPSPMNNSACTVER